MAEVVDADPEVDPAGLHGGEPHLSPKAVARDRRANPRREQQIVATDRFVAGLTQFHGVVQFDDGLALIQDLERLLSSEQAEAVTIALASLGAS